MTESFPERPIRAACAVLHTDGAGNIIPCPGHPHAKSSRRFADFDLQDCPHCEEPQPAQQMDAHVSSAHYDLPPCTARIELDHGGLYTCAFRVGHKNGEHGNWHASAQSETGRYVWNDTHKGATPCKAPEHDRNPAVTAKLSSNAAAVSRPPIRMYEVRTVHGEAYSAEGDVIESGDGWFTLWAGRSELSLRIPEADIRAVRQVDIAELDAAAEAPRPDPELADLVFRTLGIELTPGGIPYDEALHNACRQLEKSEAARAHLRRERDALNARIRQVQQTPLGPDVVDAGLEHPNSWLHGYRAGVLAARAASRPHDEATVKP